jgi:FkbM family methyltransferase
MINLIRRLIPTRMRRAAKKALGMPLTRLHPEWDMLRLIGPVGGEHVVVDAGAHHGWFFHCWLDWCPGAQVYAFEPTAESFGQTRANYGADPRVHLFQLGLGSQEGELAFNVLAGSQVSNSFLAPRQSTWDSIEYGTGAISQRTVPITTLDRFCTKEGLGRIYLLKIDVQGFELEVLKGARDTLRRIDHVFVESGIQRLYEGAPSFSEICQFMESQGFHLMHMRVWHRGNRVLVETDMLFRRNDLAPAIDRTRDRTYLELR